MPEEEHEERPSASEPNPTQQRLDEEGPSEKPADVPWEESGEEGS